MVWWAVSRECTGCLQLVSGSRRGGKTAGGKLRWCLDGSDGEKARQLKSLWMLGTASRLKGFRIGGACYDDCLRKHEEWATEHD
jgi:hypothetical protein